jgi:topoisomerase-4 subunit A
MRLRSLRKLEEMEIRGEHAKLTAERKELNRLLKDEKLRWERIAAEISELRARFGEKTALGRRRTAVGEAPAEVLVPVEALIERENLTVICSQKGWIRAFKGHLEDLSDLRFKTDDALGFALRCESTDRILVFATNGRFYTLGADKLPGARGDGEPLKIMLDMGDADIVQMLLFRGGRKLLVASSDGRGFVVPEDEVLAQTRAGKQALNLGEGAKARVCTLAEGDTVAVIGENRKLLFFPLDQLPEMGRGRGVTLQKYKDGELADARVWRWADGGWWRGAQDANLRPWKGERGQAGRLPPPGFPRARRLV